MANAKKTAETTKKAGGDQQSAKWATYEEVTRYLLNMLAKEFGVDFFEGKQRLKGKRSSSKWQVDAKGVRTSDGAIIVVECRRTKAKQSQGKVGQLAYSIIDLGGGIIVSAFDVQAGAKRIADAEKIQRVRLDPNSSREAFYLEFIDKLKVVAGIPMTISGGAPKGADTS